MTSDGSWWKDAIGYQIWPASFLDSNNDGMGDLPGIISKLDHLKDLGVDLIWLSPVYDSPQADMGYDVRDYESIWDKFGTLKDMDTLIAEAKSRGMKLIMDLVVNHTSDEHAWFQESKKSRTNPKSDWYIWRDPKTDAQGQRRPPNNWRAAFGGSVWTYVAERDQYYLHLCLEKQPDLNWTNPETRAAIYSTAVDFWLRRGVDGFRMDSVVAFWKDARFPDSAITKPDQEFQPMEGKYIMNGAPVHDWLKELRARIEQDHGPDVVLIGELPGTGTDEIVRYIDPSAKELDMILDFDHFMAGNDWHAELHERTRPALPLLKDAIVKQQDFMQSGWTSAFTENHDNPRSVDRFGPGDGEHRNAASKMLAMFLCTLSGTIFLYQGQEIGMTNIDASWTRADLRDAAGLDYLDEVERKFPHHTAKQEAALQGLRRLGRDNGRTPVQWSAAPYAGFSGVKPWIRVIDNYKAINVTHEENDPDGVLFFWRRMIKTRRQYRNQLIRGRFQVHDRKNLKTFTYVKTGVDPAEEILLVVLNFGDENAEVFVPGDVDESSMRLVLSTSSEHALDTEHGRRLDPWEGRLYSCQRKRSDV
ncbi:glycoside hydrolase family 13 protein [Trichoderma sp. SZMC 28013]